MVCVDGIIYNFCSFFFASKVNFTFCCSDIPYFDYIFFLLIPSSVFYCALSTSCCFLLIGSYKIDDLSLKVVIRLYLKNGMIPFAGKADKHARWELRKK